MTTETRTQTRVDLPTGGAELATREPEVQAGDEVDSLFGEEQRAQPPGMDAITRGEIDIQIATARKYPRDVARSIKRALDLATRDLDTAESCFYVLPRGKGIEGPSIRLAEIMAITWGNIRYGARIVEEGERFITAIGMCHDLETNTALGAEVRRRITNSKGARFNDDMIGVTGMAAQSIALRNAVFRIIPRVFVDQIWKRAQKVAVGDEKTLDERRTRAFAWYAKANVRAEQVLAKIGKRSIEEVGLEDLAILLGLSTAIREGTTTIDREFPPLDAEGKPATAAPATGAEGLRAAAAAAKAAPKAAPKAAAGPKTTTGSEKTQAELDAEQAAADEAKAAAEAKAAKGA
ncbi:MAG TPA: hypothetical protein PK948_06610 [Gemmatimonadales bacterium]|nr:hypothetical protein [Gemmatimonadales bacterium]